jgi:hypothetical protein
MVNINKAVPVVLLLLVCICSIDVFAVTGVVKLRPEIGYFSIYAKINGTSFGQVTGLNSSQTGFIYITSALPSSGIAGMISRVGNIVCSGPTGDVPCYMNTIVARDTLESQLPVNTGFLTAYGYGSAFPNDHYLFNCSDVYQRFLEQPVYQYYCDAIFPGTYAVSADSGNSVVNMYPSGVTQVSAYATVICLDTDAPISSDYYYPYRDSSLCTVCTQNDARCNNVSRSQERCSANTWYHELDCIDGGYSICGIAKSACSSVAPSITPPSNTICSSDSNCSVPGEECACTLSIVGGDGSKSKVDCGPILTGRCLFSDTSFCTSDSQCASNACTNIGITTVSGVGKCARECTVDDDCATGGSCVTPSSLVPAVFSYVQKGYTNVKNCFSKIGVTCGANDACYSGNCKDNCDGVGDSKICLATGVSCWCIEASNCPAGTGCVEYTTDQPNSNLNPFATRMCQPGQASGLSCTTDSQCSTENCQNGVCCALGQYCCSSDSQCVSGQVCYNNQFWDFTTKYFTCGPKITGAGVCSESKECVTQPCIEKITGSPQFGKICSGSNILTQAFIGIQPVDYANVIVNTTVNVTTSYQTLDGVGISGSTCMVYVNENPVTTVCGTTYRFNVTTVGTTHIRFTMFKTGYVSQYSDDILINVYSPSSLKINSQRCSIDAECSSGRCQTMYVPISNDIPTVSCSKAYDCGIGQTCSSYKYYPVMRCDPTGVDHHVQGCIYSGDVCVSDGNVSNPQAGTCYAPGVCQSPPYGMCCAAGTDACCDAVTYAPFGIDTCPNSAFKCNLVTATCSDPRISPGDICSKQAQNCVSGYACGPVYEMHNDTGICGIGTSMTATCGNYGKYGAEYACGPGMHQTAGYRCESDSQPTGSYCEWIGANYYDWCLRTNSKDKAKAICGTGANAGVCLPYTCPSASDNVLCVSCSNTNYTSIVDINTCVNGALSVIGCAADSAGCFNMGGIPGQGSINTGSQNLDANTMFSSLINLLYYMMILVMVGFGVLIIAAGMHTAIGVVKR